jgi:hypothetical protein
MDRAQLIIMVCSAILIIFGLGLIAVQMWVQVTAPDIEFRPRGIGLETMGTKASVNTTYVGLIIVVVGAFLEIVGYLASKPWKSSSGKDS